MAALISEQFKFAALFFKSKDVVIFNGLIALGTVASQTAYNIFAFECPCSTRRNYLYGLAAIGIPALGFFLIGVMLNRSTWDLVSECRMRKCRKVSGATGFALLGSIVGRAAVAPVTWSVISLLRGEAYVCALSEFVDPQSLENFPFTTRSPIIMAQFPCKDVPAELLHFWQHIERRLKYESQVTNPNYNCYDSILSFGLTSRNSQGKVLVYDSSLFVISPIILALPWLSELARVYPALDQSGL